MDYKYLKKAQELMDSEETQCPKCNRVAFWVIIYLIGLYGLFLVLKDIL